MMSTGKDKRKVCKPRISASTCTEGTALPAEGRETLSQPHMLTASENHVFYVAQEEANRYAGPSPLDFVARGKS
jgi:hypothetical protein